MALRLFPEEGGFKAGLAGCIDFYNIFRPMHWTQLSEMSEMGRICIYLSQDKQYYPVLFSADLWACHIIQICRKERALTMQTQLYRSTASPHWTLQTFWADTDKMFMECHNIFERKRLFHLHVSGGGNFLFMNMGTTSSLVLETLRSGF